MPTGKVRGIITVLTPPPMFTNPYQAAKYGYIDDVIEPRNTRFRICRALAQLANKRETRPAKKHGNIPL